MCAGEADKKQGAITGADQVVGQRRDLVAHIGRNGQRFTFLCGAVAAFDAPPHVFYGRVSRV